MKKQKYRRLEEDELWQVGDVIHYTSGAILVVDGITGETLRKQICRDSYDYVTRLLPAKRPGLTNLLSRVKSLNDGDDLAVVRIYGDGAGSIEGQDSKHLFFYFNSIDELKVYLADLDLDEKA